LPTSSDGMRTIIAENLSKLYHFGDAVAFSLRDWITSHFKRSDDYREKHELWALRDVSLEVSEGDTLAIIGNNGAGKSTLLKILSRITKPTSGSAEIRGRVGSLLEVGTGFHNELSGRDNIFLNGAILGMRKMEIERRFDEIVEFSEIEKFLDTPVKHYSSGMYMRLAFSIAAHFEPDILIVDEVLAVGDINFQRKCLGKMDEVSKSGRTVLFVSHNLGSLAQICNKGLLLDRGEVKAYGSIEDTIDTYLSSSQAQRHFRLDEGDAERDMAVSEAYITTGSGRITSELSHSEPFFLELIVNLRKRRRGAMFCVALLNKLKERVFTEHKLLDELLPSTSSDGHLRFKVPGNFIAPNDYSFLVQIFLPDGEIIHNLFDICPFSVIDTGSDLAAFKDYGWVQVKGEWEIL
jgi:lipopolysaccharide transport system ATP-binding protein